MMRPCLTCGEPSDGPRCPEHTTDPKASASARGYDAAWAKLSKRARRAQPWCSDCGSVTDLQADHTPTAWERHEAGLPIRLQDIDVCCGPCNRARGAARGHHTRGEAPTQGHKNPLAQAKFVTHTAAR